MNWPSKAILSKSIHITESICMHQQYLEAMYAMVFMEPLSKQTSKCYCMHIASVLFVGLDFIYFIQIALSHKSI